MKHRKKKKYESGGFFSALMNNPVTPLTFNALQDMITSINTSKPEPTRLTNTGSTSGFNNLGYNFELGGMINKLKQFNGPSHKQGGIKVDQNLTPINNSNNTQAKAEVEGEETSFNNFIFSKKLIDPISGKSFADKSKQINRKYGKADDDITNKSKEFEMKNLAGRNEMVKAYYKGLNNGSSSMSRFSLGGLFNNNPIPPENFTTLGNNFLTNVLPDGTIADTGFSDPLHEYINTPNNAASAQYNFDDASPFDAKQDTTTVANPDDALYEGHDPNVKGGNPYLKDGVKNRLAYASMVPMVGQTIRDLFGSAEETPLTLANYYPARQRINKMSADLTQARQDQLGAFNNQRYQINQSAMGAGQRNASLQGAYSGLRDSVGRLASQERQLRNQVLSTQGNFESQVAQDNANRITQNITANEQNKAVTEDIRRQAAQNLFNVVGTNLNRREAYEKLVQNKQQLAQLSNQEQFKLLNQLAENFGMSGQQEVIDYNNNPTPENMQRVIDAFGVRFK